MIALDYGLAVIVAGIIGSIGAITSAIISFSNNRKLSTGNGQSIGQTVYELRSEQIRIREALLETREEAAEEAAERRADRRMVVNHIADDLAFQQREAEYQRDARAWMARTEARLDGTVES